MLRYIEYDLCKKKGAVAWPQSSKARPSDGSFSGWKVFRMKLNGKSFASSWPFEGSAHHGDGIQNFRDSVFTGGASEVDLDEATGLELLY